MFVRTDNELMFTASDIEALPEIPAGNWLLKFSLNKGYYLEKTPGFKFPKKIYGNAEHLAKRYLNTFNKVEGNTGVLLTGTKGTGKSVTAKLTASISELAVVIITEPFCDDGFKSLLSNISQRCVIFIDEFEKVYYEIEWQNNFLSILDGVFEGRKLFLFTSNEKDRVNKYMLNRPGRIHYLEEYNSLDESIVNDVIEDNLNNKEDREDLLKVLNILGDITMDILMSLIREMNMYEETASEAVKYLNLKPESNSYDVKVYQGKEKLGDCFIDEHPLTQEEISVEFYLDDSSRYIRPIDEEEEEVELATAMEAKDDFYEDEKVSENTSYDEEDSVPKRKAVKDKGEWLYLTVNVATSKISHKGKEIIIESDNNMRYVFKKKSYYSFVF